MPSEEIEANNIDAAAGKILGILEGTSKLERNIYFHGWNGLGASAALKVVAQRLKSSAAQKMNFDIVVHLDCSEWKSRRALQKAVAEEIELPQSVMAIFDRHDEDDDFNGVDQGSRGEILDITEEIFRKLVNRRFVVIFHNGSGGYIDLYEFGVPITGFLSNKVLWTLRGRFRLLLTLEYKEMEKINKQTDVLIEAYPEVEGNEDDILWDLVREEAEEVAKHTSTPEHDMNHKIVEECFMYAWALRDADGIDWGTHASNYFICDGIASAWETGDALHRNMHLDWLGKEASIDYPIRRCLQRRPNERSILATHQYLQQHDNVPAKATSFFLAAKPPINTTIVLPAGMFQHSDMLRVLHLSWCTFNFASPPFLYCSNLRFLLFHHCTNITEEENQSHGQSRSWRACFGKLWVLNLSYTDWYWLLSEKMMNIMANLRELNVKGVKHWSIGDLRGGGTSLVKLRVTAGSVPTDDVDTNNQTPSPNLSCANSPNAVILDCYVGLEQVVLNNVVAAAETKDKSKGGEVAKISSISFRGCAQLKSLLLRGLFWNLQQLDLSGTSVKTLDLSTMEGLDLKQLILMGCKKLRAILWPPKSICLEMLRIDTTSQSASANRGEENLAVVASVRPSSPIGRDGGEAPHAHPHGGRSLLEQKEEKFNGWRISLVDARLLRSLLPVRGYLGLSSLHIDIYPAATVGGSSIQGTRRRSRHEQMQIIQPHTSTTVDSKYRDVFQEAAPASNYDDCADGPTPAAVMMMWDCPKIPLLYNTNQTCIIEMIIHGQDSKLLEGAQTTSTSGLLLPDYICDKATSLHVYDNSSITSIPAPLEGSTWYRLRWCRVERCSKLHTVFATLQDSNPLIFFQLKTLWASQLLMARYVWNWPSNAMSQPKECSFENLEFLHLDYCPRLIHVLPFSVHMATLPGLETLEIVCCGDLKEVFPLHLDPQCQEKIIVFPNLRRIHLHELPMLQSICGRMMSAPKLETVKIRGCWSLRRLPGVGGKTKPPKVDCEKEWWDGLEWDGLPTKHHPSLYQPSHSLYYKKGLLPSGTLLR